MSSINKVVLVGNVGADPEFKITTNGPVANIRLATTQRWTDKNGERQEATEWHRVVVWGKPAEVVHQYVKKGRLLGVEGRIQTRQWQSQTGEKRYTTEIMAQNVQMLGARSDREPTAPPAEESAPADATAPTPPSEPATVGGDDIQF
jgi:single-strand DNA-binding protein